MKLTSRIGETKSVSQVKEQIVDVHLDYIEKDGYVWRYNEDTKKYYNTGICLMGKQGNSGPPGRKGDNGLSAYQIAKEHGFDGNVQAWLDSLKGKSAYETAVENGFEGTEEEWLESLKGEDGIIGQDGVTPHIDSTTKHWMLGDEDTGIVAEGKDGEDGKSAYQTWLETDGLTAQDKTEHGFLVWLQDRADNYQGPFYAATVSGVTQEGKVYYVPGPDSDKYRVMIFYGGESHVLATRSGMLSNYTSVYDISAANDSTPYSSLQEAVSAIPSGVGKGGMEIKYIDSNSGKYRQFRLVTPYFGTPPQLVNLTPNGIDVILLPNNLSRGNGDVWVNSDNTKVHSKVLKLEKGKTYTIYPNPESKSTDFPNGKCAIHYLLSTEEFQAGEHIALSTDSSWHFIEGEKEVVIIGNDSDKGYLLFRSDDIDSTTISWAYRDPVIYVEDTDGDYTFDEDDWVEYPAANDAVILSNLDGKKIVALGDSYLRNILTTVPGGANGDEITWLKKIAIKHGMTYINYGVGGNAMVSTADTSNPKVAPMVTRYSDMDNDADFVLVVGGRNDYNAQISITDFKTGLRTLCEGLIAKYTNSGAKICFFTCWQSQKHGTDAQQYKQEDYADAIEEVCAEYSIPCFNSRKRSGVFAFDSAFRTKYFRNSTDVSHLNAAGHDYFMPRAEAFLESL